MHLIEEMFFRTRQGKEEVLDTQQCLHLNFESNSICLIQIYYQKAKEHVNIYSL